MDVTRRNFIKGLGALAGVTVASQFDRQLGALARVLAEPQEWVLTLDEAGFEQLVCKGINVGKPQLNDRGDLVADCTFEFETEDLWALVILTGQDGGEWTSNDGENWASGDRRMTL